MTAHTDALLVEKIIQKDEQALMTLFTLYEEPLKQFVRRQITEEYVVEELVQDAFIDLLESLRSFRGESKLKTYLFSIARHKVLDHIRKKRIKRIVFSKLPPRIVEGLQTVLLDDELDKRELQQRIEHVFSKLPNDYQVILRLKYIENKRMKEIARALSLSFKAAESLLFRARKAFVITYEHYTAAG